MAFPVVADVTVGSPQDLRALEDAIRAEGLCDKRVQSSLLMTMTYIRFKRQCLAALAGDSAADTALCATTFHLSGLMALEVNFPRCMLRRKCPLTAPGPACGKRGMTQPDVHLRSKVLKTQKSKAHVKCTNA